MRILAFIILVSLLPAKETQLFSVSEGEVKFTSNAPLELIQAKTYQIFGLVNTEENTFAFKVPMASFEGFNSPLQREHFNENYVESSKYPSSIFKGRILEDIDLSKDGFYDNIPVRGKFSLHGIERERELLSDITVKHGEIRIESSFLVPLVDHNIKIPSVVRRKLATQINVFLDVTMTPR